MNEKKTEDLEKVLGQAHVSDFEQYMQENQDSMLSEKNDFYQYMREIFTKNSLTQQMVFLAADIPERYGYKLLSGEKRTKQRDVILRICYAGQLTLAETQRALRKYGMTELYAKIERDALLMIIFNERPGSIIDVNALLQKHGMETLRTSGVQE